MGKVNRVLLLLKNMVYESTSPLEVLRFEEEVQECLDLGVHLTCCDLAARLIGMDASELMTGITMVPSYHVADMLIEYQEAGDLIISL